MNNMERMFVWSLMSFYMWPVFYLAPYNSYHLFKGGKK